MGLEFEQPFPRGDLPGSGVLGVLTACWTLFWEVGAAEPGAELRKNKSVMTFEVECDNLEGVFYQFKKIRHLFSKLESNPGILLHIYCS